MRGHLVVELVQLLALGVRHRLASSSVAHELIVARDEPAALVTSVSGCVTRVSDHLALDVSGDGVRRRHRISLALLLDDGRVNVP